jgi:hypothetical protein
VKREGEWRGVTERTKGTGGKGFRRRYSFGGQEMLKLNPKTEDEDENEDD